MQRLGECQPEHMSDKAEELYHSAERALANDQNSLTESRSQLDRLEAARDLSSSRISEHRKRASALDDEASTALGSYARAGSDSDDASAAVDAARDEVAILQECVSTNSSVAVPEHAAAFFQRILQQGREKHVCIGCNRGIADSEMDEFEAHVCCH